MTKSKTARALLAATCVTGSGCVGSLQNRQPPKPAECPPGAEATHKRFNVLPLRPEPIAILPLDTPYPEGWFSEGPVSARILPPWGDLPRGIRIDGELFFAKGRVHGRFTRAHLPNGEIVPVCLQLWSLDSKDAGSAGIAAAPDSTAKKARLVGRMIFAEPVPRFD